MIYDFLLMMCVCRQHLVYKYVERCVLFQLGFPGGSNRSVVDDIHHMTRMPASQAHDFTTVVRSGHAKGPLIFENL